MPSETDGPVVKLADRIKPYREVFSERSRSLDAAKIYRHHKPVLRVKTYRGATKLEYRINVSSVYVSSKYRTRLSNYYKGIADSYHEFIYWIKAYLGARKLKYRTKALRHEAQRAISALNGGPEDVSALRDYNKCTVGRICQVERNHKSVLRIEAYLSARKLKYRTNALILDLSCEHIADASDYGKVVSINHRHHKPVLRVKTYRGTTKLEYRQKLR